MVDNCIYIAKANNVGSRPSDTNSNWELIIDFNVFMAQISNQQPPNAQNGTIWFKEL